MSVAYRAISASYIGNRWNGAVEAESASMRPAQATRLGHSRRSRPLNLARAMSASASQMGRVETKWLSRTENPSALADLLGQLDRQGHRRRRNQRGRRRGPASSRQHRR